MRTKPAPAPETPTQSVPATNPAPTSPLEHLDLAITVLRNKQEGARAEIERLTALQAEEADLARQLEALTQARAAFAPAETTTSTDSGGVPAQVTSVVGTRKRNRRPLPAESDGLIEKAAGTESGGREKRS